MTTIDDDVDELAFSIWETLFDSPLELAPATGAAIEQGVSGIVHVTGSWHGAIMLQLPIDLATSLTAAMFQAPSEPTRDEITDAVGELTNMFAGNIKALLPVPSVISLPAVAFGSDYDLSVVGSTTLSRRVYSCDGHTVAVTVLERTKDDSLAGELR